MIWVPLSHRPKISRRYTDYFSRSTSTHGLVKEKRLSNIFNFRDCTLEIKGLGEDNLKDL
jgi:hypothetical protein